jgi:hypothetical protein
MTGVMETGLGSGMSVGTPVAIGVGVTVLAGCFGRLKLAVCFALPTLLLAGVANALAWLLGRDGRTPETALPAPTPIPTVTPGSSGAVMPHPAGGGGAHSPPILSWSSVVLIGVVFVLLVGGGVAQSRRARGNAAGPPPRASRWPLAYPDLPDGLDGTVDEIFGHVDTPPPPGRQPAVVATPPRWPARRTHARLGPAGWHQGRVNRLSDRMSWLLREFVTSAVPRPGRPARIDLGAPGTAWFMDAFMAAADLLVGVGQEDPPNQLADAVREAERRWSVVRGSPSPSGRRRDGTLRRG